MRVHIKVDLPEDIVKALGADRTGIIQDFTTQTILKHMGTFIPWRTGNTYQNLTEQVAPDEILVNAAWAQYIYNGINRYTGGPLNYTKVPNALAGDHWDKTMMSYDADAIVKEIEDYAKGR